MRKCLCLVEFNVTTGFGTVGTNLLNQFCKKTKDIVFDVISPNYQGENYSYNDRINVFSAELNDPTKDTFGRVALQNRLAQIDYDFLFICNDLGVVMPMIPILKKTKLDKKAANRKQFKSFFYFPIDGEYKNLYDLFNPVKIDDENLKKYESGLEFFDYLATYTNFGRQVIYNHNEKIKGKVQVIPHGTDTNIFKVLSDEERLEFRNQLFMGNSDKFIFLSLNKNQPRKDLASLILGFEDAVKNWKEKRQPFLYIHCDPNQKEGWNLTYVLKQTILKEGIHYQLLDDKHPIWGGKMPNPEQVNKIYNACDIGITTATGGGWELFITECYSTKLPLISPNHTSFKELSLNEKHSKLLKNLYPCCWVNDNVIREQIDIYELSETMCNCILEIEAYKKRANEAHKFVSEKLTWDIVSENFLMFFK